MRCSVWLAAALVGGVALCGDAVLVVEQDYNIIEQNKEGPSAKDIRQKLYIHKEMVCIDEYGGKDNSKPTETVILDLKDKKIINLIHGDKTRQTEDFEARRRRIDKRKKNVEEDLANQPPGPQRDRVERLNRALLDDKRHFSLVENPGAAKDLVGVNCNAVKIIAEDTAEYVPFEGYLHPEIEIPYDNAEALYLLQIIGDKLANFLRKHKDLFKHLPMELHLELSAGGHLDTKVVSVNKADAADFQPGMRGGLGSPFTIPDYEEKRLFAPKPGNTQDRPD